MPGLSPGGPAGVTGLVLWIGLSHQLMVPQAWPVRLVVIGLLVLVLYAYLRTWGTSCAVPPLPQVATLVPPGGGAGHSWCERCRNVKPRRAHHCSACGRCILRMDHHCSFVDNCIGLQNHKYFLLMLLYVPLASIALLASSVTYAAGLLDVNRPGGLLSGVGPFLVQGNLLLALATSAYLGLVLFFFFLFSLERVFSDETGIERLRRRHTRPSPSDLLAMDSSASPGADGAPASPDEAHLWLAVPSPDAGDKRAGRRRNWREVCGTSVLFWLLPVRACGAGDVWAHLGHAGLGPDAAATEALLAHSSSATLTVPTDL
eukprot:EG_transcript_15513